VRKEYLPEIECQKLKNVAREFAEIEGDIRIRPLGQGNINETFLVQIGNFSFVLQCISKRVFTHPKRVVKNFEIITNHIGRLTSRNCSRYAGIVKTLDGGNCAEDDRGKVWRAQTYLEDTVVFEKAVSRQVAFEAGRCLASFHRDVEDISGSELDVVLPGFHNLPGYLGEFDKARENIEDSAGDDFTFCLECVKEYRKESSYLEEMKKRGAVTERVIHGDPKISNFLFSRESGKALAMIDLDTVGPGLLLHDIGDCLRSICCTTEENNRTDAVYCDTELCESALQGYMTKGRFNKFEKEAIFYALYLITFELGVRFFTDHLKGNCYFKVDHGSQNLDRAKLQFQLVGSILEQQDKIEKIIASL